MRPKYILILLTSLITYHSHAQKASDLWNQARNGAAQKPTGDERLIAVVASYGPNIDSLARYDSTAYLYSGNRGSTLSLDLTDYNDYYTPWYDYHTYQTFEPLLKYDSSKYYTATGFGYAWELRRWRSRTYDAGNNITNFGEKWLNYNSSTGSHIYATLINNAAGKPVNITRYQDTSLDLTGMFNVKDSTHIVYQNGLRESDTVFISYSSGTLQKAFSYLYNSFDQFQSVHLNQYSPTEGVWDSLLRVKYNYDPQERLYKMILEPHNGGWYLLASDSFGYTGSGNQYTFHDDIDGANIVRTKSVLNAFVGLDSSFQYEQNIDGDLTLSCTKVYEYNSNHHLTKVVSYFWSYYNPSAPQALDEVSEVRYYYSPSPASVDEITRPFATLSPNPVSNNVTVAIHAPTGSLRVSITNMAGQLLYEQGGPAARTLDINTAALPAGLYNVTLRMGDAVQTLKLVKE